MLDVLIGEAFQLAYPSIFGTFEAMYGYHVLFLSTMFNQPQVLIFNVYMCDNTFCLFRHGGLDVKLGIGQLPSVIVLTSNIYVAATVLKLRRMLGCSPFDLEDLHAEQNNELMLSSPLFSSSCTSKYSSTCHFANGLLMSWAQLNERNLCLQIFCRKHSNFLHSFGVAVSRHCPSFQILVVNSLKGIILYCRFPDFLKHYEVQGCDLNA